MKGRSVRVDDDRWATAEAFAEVWNVSTSEVVRRAIDALHLGAIDGPLETGDQCPQSVQFPHRLELAEPVQAGDTALCIAQPEGVFCGCTFVWRLSDLVTEAKIKRSKP